MGVNHEGVEMRPREFGVQETLMQTAPIFCHVLKFKHHGLLALQCIIKYQSHDSNRVFTTSQKHIFNVHQITTSGGEFNIFWRRHGQKYRPECTKTRHFKCKIHFFLESGIGILHRYPLFTSHSLPHQAFRIPTCVPSEFHPDLRHWSLLLKFNSQLITVYSQNMTFNSW